MFSVIIPLYNKELTIESTVKSVLNQTFNEFEIIVINDGSLDKGARIVESIADSRIKLIHQENQGVSAARNNGIKNANFKWIAFLDGDDLWKPNHLEEIMLMREKFNEAKVFTTSFEFSDSRAIYRQRHSERVFKIENYFKQAQKEYLIWTSVAVVHCSCFNVVGTFNEALNRGEDRDLWARLAISYEIVKSQAVTAIYNKEDDNSLTNSKAEYSKSIVSVVKLKGKKADERYYYKKIVYQRIKSQLKAFNLKEVALLICKHNIELIK